MSSTCWSMLKTGEDLKHPPTRYHWYQPDRHGLSGWLTPYRSIAPQATGACWRYAKMVTWESQRRSWKPDTEFLRIFTGHRCFFSWRWWAPCLEQGLNCWWCVDIRGNVRELGKILVPPQWIRPHAYWLYWYSEICSRHATSARDALVHIAFTPQDHCMGQNYIDDMQL